MNPKISSYSKETNETLKGKTIACASVDGYSIDLVFTDGTLFTYEATDGGYSTWDIVDNKEDKEDVKSDDNE